MRDPDQPALTPPRFSVVTAAYEVQPYLADYFAALERQSGFFPETVQVVLVDDGSSDQTLALCRAFQARFPQAVTVLTQPNTGAAAARNLGLSIARGDWVTFLDADDWVEDGYFAAVATRIAAAAAQGQSPVMALARLAVVSEVPDQPAPPHPLDYRFVSGAQALRLDALGAVIVMNAASVFFEAGALRRQSLLFSPDIRPGFEDSHFANSFLLACADSDHVLIVPEAVYCYRKRADGSSTIDTAWRNPAKYDAQLRGVLDLLRKAAQRQPRLPPYIQRAALYEVAGHVRRVLAGFSNPADLTEAELAAWGQKLETILRQIEPKVLAGFKLGRLSETVRLGLVQWLTGKAALRCKIRVLAVRDRPDEVELRYTLPPGAWPERVYLDGQPLLPLAAAQQSQNLFGRPFLITRRLRYRVGAGRFLSLYIGELAVGVLGRGLGQEGVVDLQAVESKAERSLENPAYEAIRAGLPDLPAARRRCLEGAMVFSDGPGAPPAAAFEMAQAWQNLRPAVPVLYLGDAASVSPAAPEHIAFGSDDHIRALLLCREVVTARLDPAVLADQPASLLDRERPQYLTCLLDHLPDVAEQDRLSRWPVSRILVTDAALRDGVLARTDLAFFPDEIVVLDPQDPPKPDLSEAQAVTGFVQTMLQEGDWALARLGAMRVLQAHVAKDWPPETRLLAAQIWRKQGALCAARQLLAGLSDNVPPEVIRSEYALLRRLALRRALSLFQRRAAARMPAPALKAGRLDLALLGLQSLRDQGRIAEARQMLADLPFAGADIAAEAAVLAALSGDKAALRQMFDPAAPLALKLHLPWLMRHARAQGRWGLAAQSWWASLRL